MDNGDAKKFFDCCAEDWDARETTPIEKVVSLIDICLLQKGDKTLDVGCGTGIVSGLLAERSAGVTAVDVSEKMLSVAKKKHEGKGIEFVCADFYDFVKTGYDCAVVYNAYPHFLDKDRFAKTLASVLKVGGRAVILHSMGREELNSHHQGVMNISFAIRPVQEEIKTFLPYFDVDYYLDAPDRFAIRLIKK